MKLRNSICRRQGVVLIVALGMLALFAVLAATYLSFASNSRQTAFANARKELRPPQHETFLHESAMQLIRGTKDTKSIAFRHDLLGDLYGYDSTEMGAVLAETERFAFSALPTSGLHQPSDMSAAFRERGVLSAGAKVVKVPVRFVDPIGGPNTTESHIVNGPTFGSVFNLDDALTGRTVTFIEGPLAGNTVKIVRWVGARETDAERHYEYSMLLDFDSDDLPSSVELDDGTFVELATILSTHEQSAACLFYRRGPDGAWGTSNDDDGNALASYVEAGWPLSDDVAYALRLNPVARNGMGTGYHFEDVTNPTDLNQHQHIPITVRDPSGATTTFWVPAALQPNYTRWAGDWIASGQRIRGDADERYDAADFENFFLSTSVVDNLGSRVIPSFHRPAVINYLLNQVDFGSSFSSNDIQLIVESIRRATGRPLPFSGNQSTHSAGLPVGTPHPTDWNPSVINNPTRVVGGEHPDFTGSNEHFALRWQNRITEANAIHVGRLNDLATVLTEGPWDVDNDRDGENDSIWTNFNLPLIRAADGTLLRPMVAAQVEDLSARFNLNAHGNSAQLRSSYHQNPDRGLATNTPNTPGSFNLLVGRGVGPAEIVPVLTANPSAVLFGSSLGLTLQRVYELRYRSGDSAELVNGLASFSVPGATGGEGVHRLSRASHPATHSRLGGYGFPLDVFGQGGLGVDIQGNLHQTNAGLTLASGNDAGGFNRQVNESDNHPYEFDPSGNRSGDRPFTLAEWERVVSANSWDQHLLPTRLQDAIGGLVASDPTVANIITTISKSDGRAPVATLPEQRGTVGASGIVEALLTKIFAGRTNRTITDTDIAIAHSLLSPELKRGLKLDVNRPFGNGVDDDGDGTIDERQESTSSHAGIDPGVAAPDYNFNSDQLIAGTGMIPDGRQLLAQNLYTAAMLVMSDQYDWQVADVTNITPANKQQYVARRIAQWAVNVVDFRDPDAINTRFYYDNDISDGFDLTVAATRDEVWGCEFPELVFTESLSLHDVRLKDTALDSTNRDTRDATNPDENLDSIRMPQGSTFLEFRSTRARNDGTANGLPPELYSLVGGDAQLDLDRRAPAGAGAPAMPVWRVAISETHHSAKGNADRSPLNRKGNFVNTASFNPDRPDELDLGPAALSIDRYVLFNEYENRAALDSVIKQMDGGKSWYHAYCNLSPTVSSTKVTPGEYFLVAPRRTTHIGSKIDTTNIPEGVSDQRFDVQNGLGLVQYDFANMQSSLQVGVEVKAPSVMLAQSFIPAGWGLDADAAEIEAIFGTDSGGIGLNISEPTANNYYAQPTQYADGAGGDYPQKDAYHDFLNGSADVPRDNPQDLSRSGPVSELSPANDAMEDDPFIGHVGNYRTAYLQRLADPTKAFNNDPLLPEYNPYLTVDWISLDLTVFSGDQRSSYTEFQGPADFVDRSRSRNGAGPRGPANLLFSNRTQAPNGGGAVTAGTNFIDNPIDASLGYLNPVIGPPLTNADVLNMANIGDPAPAGLGGPGSFGIYPWLNRPFASPLEVMLVPAVSQGRLFEEYDSASGGQIYLGADSGGSIADQNAPFGYLLNFFQGSSTEATDNPGLYRLLDYLGTGPSFNGSYEVRAPLISSSNYKTSFLNSSEAQAAYDAWHSVVQFPFNYEFSGSDSGKLNLNTISDPRVWRGLNWGHMSVADRSLPVLDGSWSNFSNSRRGYLSPGSGTHTIGAGSRGSGYYYAPHLHPQFPSQFAGVFTDAVSSDLRPTLSQSPEPEAMRVPHVAGTLLRPGLDGSGDLTTSSAVFVTPGNGALHERRDLQPLMRYGSMMRLANLTSCSSDTFVIRLTLGYFEVDPSTLDLGKEYGSDEGTSKRYSATYIVDRSIPCNYEPGEDNDTEKLILFERFNKE